jgi:hypothetical protein
LFPQYFNSVFRQANTRPDSRKARGGPQLLPKGAPHPQRARQTRIFVFRQTKSKRDARIAMRTFLALVALVVLPGNLHIALVIVAFAARGFFSPLMTAFLMTLGDLPNDIPRRRLRQPSWRR